jgi:hypothetical protein
MASNQRVGWHVVEGKGLVDQLIDSALHCYMSDMKVFPKHEYKFYIFSNWQ